MHVGMTVLSYHSAFIVCWCIFSGKKMKKNKSITIEVCVLSIVTFPILATLKITLISSATLKAALISNV